MSDHLIIVYIIKLKSCLYSNHKLNAKSIIYCSTLVVVMLEDYERILQIFIEHIYELKI